MLEFLKTLLGVVVGVAIIAGAIAGAIAAWRFWNIDGFVASIMGASGLALIGGSLGKDIIS